MWRGAILAFLVYLLFIVQLGERSAFGHLVRVIQTEEAQELGHEVSVATRRLAEQIGDQVEAANAAPDMEAVAAQVPEVLQDDLEHMVADVRDEAFELPGDEPTP
jgi:hypothetical protein